MDKQPQNTKTNHSHIIQTHHNQHSPSTEQEGENPIPPQSTNPQPGPIDQDNTDRSTTTKNKEYNSIYTHDHSHILLLKKINSIKHPNHTQTTSSTVQCGLTPNPHPGTYPNPKHSPREKPIYIWIKQRRDKNKNETDYPPLNPWETKNNLHKHPHLS